MGVQQWDKTGRADSPEEFGTTYLNQEDFARVQNQQDTVMFIENFNYVQIGSR